MNILCEPNDELLKSLVEETCALPQAAAAQARARQRTRTKAVRVAATLSVSLLAAGIWFYQRAPRHVATKEIARAASPPEAAKTSTRQGYVKVYQAGEAVAPDAILTNMSEREKKLLTELPDVPLLIVKNSVGEIARVHIFER